MKNVLIVIIFICTAFAGNAQIKVGQQAPVISLPDTKDSAINLSSLKGKVVLIDFWASWCRPCRATNPGLVKLYKKYKATDFEIVGISIDKEKDDWLKAIKQDKIPYLQLIDHGGWDTGVAGKYGVEEIPATFLLDKEGKIIAINLEGKELEEKIKELIARVPF